MKNVLICGAGGFIGGHLAQYLKKLNKYNLICVDVKPKEYWFQISDNNQNYSLDLKEYDNCLKVTKDINFVYNMACNMGGMGFIENNKAECMLSVLINTNLLRACVKNKLKDIFFHQVHVFTMQINKKKFLLMD
jgi:nucleoside-diphosphate-sugar epimerase